MRFIANICRPNRALSAILLFAIASSVSAAQTADWRSRVSPDLLGIYDATTARITPSIKATVASTPVTERSTARFDAGGRVQVDVNFDCADAAPSNALKTAGLLIDTTVKAPPMCVVEGWAATVALPSLAAVASVKTIVLPHYAKTPVPISPSGRSKSQSLALPQAGGGTPVIDGNGVTIMNADKYIAQTGANDQLKMWLRKPLRTCSLHTPTSCFFRQLGIMPKITGRAHTHPSLLPLGP